MAKGLQVQGSYVYGKSLDNTSSTSSVTAGTGLFERHRQSGAADPGINRGLSDFDIRHNGVVSVIYDLPDLHRGAALLRGLANGWELGTISRIQTGMPFTVVLNSDQAGQTKADTTGAGLGERPNLVNSADCRTLTNPGNINAYIKTQCFTYPQPVTINGVTGTVLGNLSRNALTSPGLFNTDLSLIHNHRFAEKVTTQFRAEAFNVLNHPNFSAPSFVIYDSSGKLISNVGQITSTTTTSRQIQFGLKVSF